MSGRERVRDSIRALARGGGYIFAGVHNIPGDTPVGHLEAILEAYGECREYQGIDSMPGGVP